MVLRFFFVFFFVFLKSFFRVKVFTCTKSKKKEKEKKRKKKSTKKQSQNRLFLRVEEREGGSDLKVAFTSEFVDDPVAVLKRLAGHLIT